MTTTLHNAAPQAVQAKPCQDCPDNFPLPEARDHFDRQVVQGYIERRRTCALRPAAGKPCLAAAAAPATPAIALSLSHVVLQAEDDAEALCAVLSGYRGIESLLALADFSRDALSGDELSELLHALNQTFSTRLDALEFNVDAVRAALRLRPMAGPVAGLAVDVADQVGWLRAVRQAYEALRKLLPHAEHTPCVDLSAALQAINDALATQVLALDGVLTALHAALVLSEAAQRGTDAQGAP